MTTVGMTPVGKTTVAMTTVQESAIQHGRPVSGDQAAAGASARMPPVLSILAAAMTATMLDLGERTGLTRALAQGPADAAELARRTGGDERLIEEWLRSLDAAGLLVSAGSKSQWTPDAAAMLAAPAGSPGDLSAGIGLFSALASCVPMVAAAFGSGAVPAGDYPPELAATMQRLSDGWTSGVLPQLWVPAIEGVAGRLEAGGRVAEIGCGGGHALQALGRRYPAMTADGFELDGQTGRGRQRAAGRGRPG